MITFQKHVDCHSVCTITLKNIINHTNAFVLIGHIINYFAVGEELFFGHYRVDGFHLSQAELIQYSKEIPAYFKRYGDYHPIEIFKNISIDAGEGLTACRCANDKPAYEMFEKIFQYYLETMLFCPKISWMDFLELHKSYMKRTAEEYIIKDYTDFLFLYVDSGDFSIMFDSRKYSPTKIGQSIKQIIYKTTEDNLPTM